MPRRRRIDEVRDVRIGLYRKLVRDAAERVFAQHGFARASVAQVAREAGVSIGTIYRVFPGRKHEIYRTIQEHRGTALIGSTQAVGIEAWRRRGDLIDAVLEAVNALVAFFVAHPDYLRLVLREETAWAVGPKRGSTEQAAMWREGISGAVMAMRQGIADGQLVGDDPEAMARTWVAMQQAELGYWLEQGGRVNPADVARRLQRMFLGAFCKPEVAAARGIVELPPAQPAKE